MMNTMLKAGTHCRPGGESRGGFTLIELMVVVAVIGILASLLLPALARSKQKATSIKCISNMRQIGIALQVYADDFEDRMPPRTFTRLWTERLYPYYNNLEILKCPAEKEGSRRSYLINGWNDYFRSTLPEEEFNAFMRFQSGRGMKFSQIPIPSDTITFGEKKTDSPHAYMDFLQGGSGNDLEEVEHARHMLGSNRRAGSSNYVFADGSVRDLKFGRSVTPVNLWAVTDEWRNAPPVPLERIE